MPELAEVEYYRRLWDAGFGARILVVELHARKRVFRGSNTLEIVRCLTGARLLQSIARGKQMLFQFSGESWLGLHLGMTGKLRVEPPQFRPESRRNGEELIEPLDIALPSRRQLDDSRAE